MNQNEMQKKIEELMANTEFTDKLSQCETFDEIAALFGTEGIEVSGEELEKGMERISVQNENGEIGEDDLEQVSGGFLVTGTSFLIGCICYSIATVGYAIHLAKNKKKQK